MSNTAKIVIGALVVLLVLGLAYGYQTTKTNAPSESVDTSDQALEEDTAAIDAELEGLEDDEALIDQGLEEDVSVQ